MLRRRRAVSFDGWTVVIPARRAAWESWRADSPRKARNWALRINVRSSAKPVW